MDLLLHTHHITLIHKVTVTNTVLMPNPNPNPYPTPKPPQNACMTPLDPIAYP